jgi:hypothetical protein
MNIERSVINHLGRFLSLPSLATKLSRIFSVLNPFHFVPSDDASALQLRDYTSNQTGGFRT